MTKALKKSDGINEPGCDLARIHVNFDRLKRKEVKMPRANWVKVVMDQVQFKVYLLSCTYPKFLLQHQALLSKSNNAFDVALPSNAILEYNFRLGRFLLSEMHYYISTIQRSELKNLSVFTFWRPTFQS